MKKRVVTVWILGLFLVLASCDRWLDTSTENKVPIDKALLERQGFIEALAGIYKQMGREELYGRELEFGLLDVLAGYWEIGPDHPYEAAYQYNYDVPSVKSKIVAIWSGLYSCIRQCNLLLEHMDNIENDPYHDIIKGEILGLRAYFHLELLRIYGPVISEKSGLDSPSIPYYEDSTKKQQPILSSRECLTKIEYDLQAAKKLLSKDPIIVLGREGNGNNSIDPYENSLIDRRGIRMNLYAVLALLARKSQWEADMQTAKARAEELIDLLTKSRTVYFTPKEVRLSLSDQVFSDRRLSCENIFGLYIEDIMSKTSPYFNFSSDSMLRPDYYYLMKRKFEEGTGSKDDYRWRLWRPDKYPFLKFIPSQLNEDIDEKVRAREFEVSLINLSEVYFIAAEAYLSKDVTKALDLVNIVRLNRDLPPVKFAPGQMTTEQVRKLFLDEICREYIGEGYVFLLHKHLAYGVYRFGGIQMLPGSIFQFPIPSVEYAKNIDK